MPEQYIQRTPPELTSMDQIADEIVWQGNHGWNSRPIETWVIQDRRGLPVRLWNNNAVFKTRGAALQSLIRRIRYLRYNRRWSNFVESIDGGVSMTVGARKIAQRLLDLHYFDIVKLPL